MSPEIAFSEGTPKHILSATKTVDEIVEGMIRGGNIVSKEKFQQIVQAVARINTPRIFGIFPIRRLSKVEKEVARLSLWESQGYF